MASNRSIDEIVNGFNLPIEVVSKFHDILVVINTTYSLKGVLLPANDDNKNRLENFLHEYRKSEERKSIDNGEESLVCVPDSTLSLHTAPEDPKKPLDERRCSQCQRAIAKPPVTKNKRSMKSVISRELERLTTHGFNECLLAKKNSSRRVSARPADLPNGAPAKRRSKGASSPAIKRRQSHQSPATPVAIDDTAASPPVSPAPLIRQTQSRALKTRANEKIIDLCSPRSSKARKSEPPVTPAAAATKPAPRPKNEPAAGDKTRASDSELEDEDELGESPIKLSDVSIYDFVGDEDCESEPNRVLYGGQSAGGNKSYFVDKSSNRSRVDKRGYQRKTGDKLSKKIRDIVKRSAAVNNNKKIDNDNNNNNSASCRDDEIHSDPGIVSAEYKGARFSINNIVWAKIPGYPFWPAHIKSFDNVSASKSQGKRCRINWIGWNQKSFLPLKSLLHFKDHFPAKYSAKFKSQKYKTAIELACRELGLDLNELVANAAALGNGTATGGSSPRPAASAAAVRAERQNAVFGKRSRAIDLDRIFPAKGGGAGGFEVGLGAAKAAYSDEDTDEEEKARGVLITVESLEAANRGSSKKPNFDF